MTSPRSRQLLAALALVSVGGVAAGCTNGTDLVGSVMGKSEAEKVPEDSRFIDQPAGTARAAEVTTRHSQVKGLLGPELYDIDGPVNAARFTAYMHQVLDRQLQNYPGARPVRRIYIDASDEINAFATPQGDIWVSVGLIEKLDNESELAAVLAHEAGHIQLDHFASTEYFEAQRKSLTAGAGASLMAISLAHSDVKISNAKIQTTQADPAAVQEQSLAVVAGSWLINEISDGVVATWWQRLQEEQADLVAADLLSASGYDPDGITALLAMMGKESEQRLELAKAITKRRDEQLAELAKSDPRQAMQHLPELVVAHAKDFAAGTGGDIWAILGADHPRPQDRQRSIAPYVDARYDEQRFGPKKLTADQKRLAEAIRSGLPERLREGHHAANAARQQLAEGDVAAAAASIDKALRTPAANSAHVRSIAYVVAKAQSRNDAAFRHLNAVAPDELKPRRLFEFMAVEYAQRGRWNDAEGAIRAGVKQFGDEEPFLPATITLAVGKKDVDDARAAHERCRSVESESVRLACDNAIAPLGLEDLEPAVAPGILDYLGKAVPDFGALGSKAWQSFGT
ncbi:MAG: M48 family metallopeptidase [Geminicoccaceae bacterium]